MGRVSDEQTFVSTAKVVDCADGADELSFNINVRNETFR